MRGNDNIQIAHHEHAEIQTEIELHTSKILEALRIDWKSDSNMAETPTRFAKMLVREIFSGRFNPMPKMTVFPNTKGLDELYVTGPIGVRSTCSHHLMPIHGKCWIGIIPGEFVLGLSKFNRLVDWVASRPQIQEEMVMQIADAIEHVLEPKGLAVVVKAQHFCMIQRGVRESHEANMTTSVMRGALRDNPEARAEFFSLIR